MKIALAGNPNAGKTTLFNALTCSNQFVGNWPGVTVEKKEGKLKGHTSKENEVIIMDLPGIYSLSPYTLEEVVSRNYLVNERPDGILNIIDGTNLERNLYLTTQLAELGIPMVVAINMMDVVRKNGDKIHIEELQKALGCPVVEISALKNKGCMEAAEKAIEVAKARKLMEPPHRFSGCVEHALAHIEEAVLHDMPEEKQRWFAVKLFERDEKVIEQLNVKKETLTHIEEDIKNCEKELNDDSESIITSERYSFIESIINKCRTKKSTNSLSASDKIDRVVTNRWLALPIFAVIMWFVYFVSVTTVGTWGTDWANDGVFGDGWHLFTIGSSKYADAADEYTAASQAIDAFTGLDLEAEDFDADAKLAEIKSFTTDDASVQYTVEDEETLEDSEITVYFDSVPEDAGDDVNPMSFNDAVAYFEGKGNFDEIDPADYGIWIPGIPVLVESLLTKLNCAEWLSSLILDGIVAGVGAVLGFVPQILVLFIFLAFLEACGYMARIAFIMDRIFRKFGLSGKSFIPMLIGTGCGIPGIMASRTIESDRDRKMTIMTTTFIPCGAKLPFIAMIAGSIFGGASWIAPSAFFLGIAAIVISGIILKKTKIFAGDVAPFVMELPAYHWPTVGSVLRSMWERGYSFIKKAGTIILLSTIVIWFLQSYGVVDGHFQSVGEDLVDCSLLGYFGRGLSWIFAPLGFGNWQATVAAITGLVAKENIVGTLGILYNSADASVYATMATKFTLISGYAFLAFNLLCAPCFAAMGAIKREMNNTKWFWIAIGYQCGFAYLVAMMINQIGSLFTTGFSAGTILGFAALAFIIFMLVRKNKYASK